MIAGPRGEIVILSRDLLFGVSIRNSVRQLGFTPLLVTSTATLSEALLQPERAPALVIVDLAAVGAGGDWGAIRAVVHRPCAVLVFGPHMDVAGLRAAKDAGVTRVVSNGQFHREMGALIERYARGAASPPPGPNSAADAITNDPPG